MQDELKRLWREKCAEFRSCFDRTIPLTEMVVDRWEKARLLGFGKDSSIHDNAFVHGDVRVGEDVWVGPYTVLDGTGGHLRIGSSCSISAHVLIYTHDTVKWAVTGTRAPYEKSPVEIGDCVYIGPHSLVSRGVTIGDHVIIGAYSLVNSDIPSNSVAWGQPARVVGSIEMNEDGSDYVIRYNVPE